MLKTVETNAWYYWDTDFKRANRYKEIYNTQDTFISIMGRYGHDKWEKFVEEVAALGFKINVLYDDKAINHYVSHRGEYLDTDDKRFCQRLVIYEFNEVPQ